MVDLKNKSLSWWEELGEKGRNRSVQPVTVTVTLTFVPRF
jgi:hypothetical protein